MTQAPPVLPYITPRRAGDARNAVDEAIVSRQSIRQFLSKPVPRETIAHLLEVASRAPSGTSANNASIDGAPMTSSIAERSASVRGR